MNEAVDYPGKSHTCRSGLATKLGESGSRRASKVGTELRNKKFTFRRKRNFGYSRKSENSLASLRGGRSCFG